MLDRMFTSEALEEALWILKNEFPMAIWETMYVTVLATLFAIVLGLPLGVLLVAGEKNGVLPLPAPVMSDCRYVGRYGGIHCAAGHRRISVCRASGRIQPA